MSYNNNFYNDYNKYVMSKSVRNAHDFIFSIIMDNANFENVVDLGCGKVKEFYNYSYNYKRNYVGIDINPECEATITDDYRKMDFERFSNITSFVSLFSSEITDTFVENYKLYQRIFKEMPNVQYGLVSGFFYSDKKNSNPVVETGGIESYQTLEGVEQVKMSEFSETRITLHVPSEMFGPNVYEVWKIFKSAGIESPSRGF